MRIRYRDDPEAIASLVQQDQVHRDVYIDPEIFHLEMENLWTRTWIYVGHTSQVPNPGDYFTTEIALQPVILVRHTDGSVRVLLNRCAHKGAKVVSSPHGNTGKHFRCSYHAWTYRRIKDRKSNHTTYREEFLRRHAWYETGAREPGKRW